MHPTYDELTRLMREAGTLASVAELLGWDQETMMPPKAADFRAEEIALLARLAHDRATDPRLGELLARCEDDEGLRADERVAANLIAARRDYDRARKLPSDLVAELSATGSRAMEAWKQARADSDFAAFLPWLEQQVTLNQRKAECWGPPAGGDLYDALLDDFEPGTTGTEVQRLFGPLRAGVAPLIEAIVSRGREPDPGPLGLEIPLEAQREFNRLVLARVGFDLEAGRLDVSAHPFSSGLAPGDTRITTRYRADQLLDTLGSTLHEAGHGLYEQGLPKRRFHGQPLSEPLGLGIHESQSRLWENQVGRSLPFWTWALPEARRILGRSWARFSVEDVHAAVNLVRPNLIRIESDEATYNLHIMLRFDLERSMILGELQPADLPGAWNERIRTDLGLEVPDDARGCMQDVHWSMGAFGYFPSYTLGNLYAAQFWGAIREALPDLDRNLSVGDFAPLLGWLRENVHAHGRRYPADELCRRLTGRPLCHEPLVRYLGDKFGALYGLDGAETNADG